MQFYLCRQPFCLHTSLTFRAFMPNICWALISSYVYVFAWKYGSQFGQYILYKLKHRVIACTQQMFFNTPSSANLIWTSCTSKLWICCQSCHCMTRHLYLWNYCNPSNFGIFYQFLQLLLLEITPFIHRPIYISSLSAHLCQKRIFLHLKGP